MGKDVFAAKRMEYGRDLVLGTGRRMNSRRQAPRSAAEQGAVATGVVKSCRVSP